MKLFLIVLFILNTLHLTAQEKMICFSVLSNDLSASTECRLDDKGKALETAKFPAVFGRAKNNLGVFILPP